MSIDEHVKMRIDRAIQTSTLQSVLESIFADGDIPYRIRYSLAKEYAGIWLPAEHWALSNFNEYDLLEVIEVCSLDQVSVSRLLRNSHASPQVLLNSLDYLSDAMAYYTLVNEMKDDAITAEFIDKLVTVVYTDGTPIQDGIIGVAGKKHYDWAKDLPNSWVGRAIR